MYMVFKEKFFGRVLEEVFPTLFDVYTFLASENAYGLEGYCKYLIIDTKKDMRYRSWDIENLAKEELRK